MPHIPLEEHLPGITGLLEYRKRQRRANPRADAVFITRTIIANRSRRELIATIVSHGNECLFCTTAHTAAANKLLGECNTTQAIKANIESAPVSDKMKALLIIAKQVQQSGRNVTEASIQRARKAGATDIEIHDTVLIAALFLSVQPVCRWPGHKPSRFYRLLQHPCRTPCNKRLHAPSTRL